MLDLSQVAEATKTQMQPAPRANATASTLLQIAPYVPDGVTLSDLIVGWKTCSHPFMPNEEGAVSQRRVTCAELAKIAAQFAIGEEEGSLTQAIKAWEAWANIPDFSQTDPRQAAILRTSKRELLEMKPVE